MKTIHVTHGDQAPIDDSYYTEGVHISSVTNAKQVWRYRLSRWPWISRVWHIQPHSTISHDGAVYCEKDLVFDGPVTLTGNIHLRVKGQCIIPSRSFVSVLGG